MIELHWRRWKLNRINCIFWYTIFLLKKCFSIHFCFQNNKKSFLIWWCVGICVHCNINTKHEHEKLFCINANCRTQAQNIHCIQSGLHSLPKTALFQYNQRLHIIGISESTGWKFFVGRLYWVTFCWQLTRGGLLLENCVHARIA